MIESSHQPITYAVFADPERAERVGALIDLDPNRDAEVEVITDSADLGHEVIPVRLTMARAGALGGVAVAMVLSLFAIAGIVWAGLGPLGHRPLAPYVTTAIAVMLAGGLGALGGGLALTTQLRGTLTRLRRLVDYGHTVLLVESDADLNVLLKRHGAMQTGVLV